MELTELHRIIQKRQLRLQVSFNWMSNAMDISKNFLKLLPKFTVVRVYIGEGPAQDYAVVNTNALLRTLLVVRLVTTDKFQTISRHCGNQNREFQQCHYIVNTVHNIAQ